MSANKYNDGFTLLELIIATFIGTMLIMASAYAIKTGLSSMEKEEAWFNDLSKERAAFEFFWQQTSSLHQLDTSGETNENERRLPKKTTKKTNTQKEASSDFRGEKDSLVFVTPLSLMKHYGQGMILAQYKIVYNVNGKYDLIYLETPLNSTIKKTWAEEFENKFIINKDVTFFFKDYDAISFAYITGEEADDDKSNITNNKTIQTKDSKEEAIWKEKLSGETPQAIKLTVSTRGQTQELLSPIMVTYSSSASGQ